MPQRHQRGWLKKEKRSPGERARSKAMDSVCEGRGKTTPGGGTEDCDVKCLKIWAPGGTSKYLQSLLISAPKRLASAVQLRPWPAYIKLRIRARRWHTRQLHSSSKSLRAAGLSIPLSAFLGRNLA
jgi:hypothetical protein